MTRHVPVPLGVQLLCGLRVACHVPPLFPRERWRRSQSASAEPCVWLVSELSLYVYIYIYKYNPDIQSQSHQLCLVPLSWMNFTVPMFFSICRHKWPNLHEASFEWLLSRRAAGFAGPLGLPEAWPSPRPAQRGCLCHPPGSSGRSLSGGSLWSFRPTSRSGKPFHYHPTPHTWLETAYIAAWQTLAS